MPRAKQVALDLGKPELDLIEPGRIRRREMQLHARMLQQETSCTAWVLCADEIVDNDVNLAPPRLRGDDVARNSTNAALVCRGHGLADDLAGLRIERGVQRERAVAVGTRTHGVRRGRATAAAPDPGDPAPEWPSSHRRQTPPRAAADSDTARSHRRLSSRSPGRPTACSVRGDAAAGRRAARRARPAL